MFFFCVGNKEKQEVEELDTHTSSSCSSKFSSVQNWKQNKSTAESLSFENSNFGCQYSLQSNQSLEIKSRVLTRSVSQFSTQSIFSIKLRKRIRKGPQEPKGLKSVFTKFAKKLFNKKCKGKAPLQNNNKNLFSRHMPKKNSKTCVAPNTKQEKPLVIRDELPIESVNAKKTMPRNKICRPGEVLFKRSTCLKLL
jgi:hypothetical protein